METEEPSIMEKSLSWYNYQNAKRKADIEALRECQLWNEEKQLDYTPTPPTPKVKSNISKINYKKFFKLLAP